MLRSRRLAPTLLVIILTAAPLAIAGWSGKGNYEPDTRWDQLSPYMELNATAGNVGNHVYFNGFIGQDAYPFATDISPNVGMIGTQQGNNHYTIFTMMGVWRDCNQDGFVGLGDQGLWEYRPELLLNSTLCPPQAVPVGNPGGAVVHNDGRWVQEFIPIAWKAWFGDQNPYDINDNSSRVWYDYGLPGDLPTPTCWLYPHPRGTYHSVGGLLFTYDCLTNYQITDKFDALVDAAGLHQYSFGDANRTQYASASQANVKNPWGEEYQGSDVQAWDCSQPQLAQAATPAGPSGSVNPIYLNVSAPNTGAATSVNTGGSPAGTANATAAGLDRCNRRTDTAGGGRGGGAATLPYVLEGDVTQSVARQNPNGILSARTASRGHAYCPVTTDPDPAKCDVGGQTYPNAADAWGPVTGDSTPRDGGLRQGPTTYAASTDGFWTENVAWLNPWPATTDDGAHVDGGAYITYYGFVSPSAVSTYNLVLPSTSTGSYGAENCGLATTGIVKGWDCDASHWYKDANGNDAQPRSFVLGRDQSLPAGLQCTGSGTGTSSRGCVSYAAFPGSPYNLRDIDCWDDSNAALRGLGITEGSIAQLVDGLLNQQPRQCLPPT